MLKTKESRINLIYYLLLIAFSLLVGYISLGKGCDFNVYDSVAGDSMLGKQYIKSIDENGIKGILFNSRIGAPETSSLIDFPACGTTTFVILWIISLFTDSIPGIMYTFLILSFALDSVSMSLLMRKLQFNRETSFVISSLFAFAPFHFYRYIGHFSLIDYFTVPAAIYLSLCILEIINEDKKWKMAAAAILLGLGYGYYYAFGLIMMAVAYLVRFIVIEDKKQIIKKLWIIGVTLVSVLVSLSPKIIYNLTNGANEVAGKRVFFEQELYGLKIINLLLPVSYSRIGIFRKISDFYLSSGAPLQNENTWASLGLIGSLGFVTLCVALIISFSNKKKCDDRQWKLIDFLSLQTLVFVLVGSIGGFGEIFNAIVTPQIRCYNRSSIFLTALSLLMVAVLLNKIEVKKKAVSYAVCAGVLAVGCFDQVYILPEGWQNGVIPTQRLYEDYFAEVEASLDEGAMVYQLPYMDFPEVGSLNNLAEYKHFVGYIFTDDLRWSYGGVKGRNEAAKQLNIDEGMSLRFLNGVKNAGFQAVYIDTDGYADGGNEIISFYNSLGFEPIVSSDGKLYTYDISEYSVMDDRQAYVVSILRKIDNVCHIEPVSMDELKGIADRILQNDTSVYSELTEWLNGVAKDDSEYIHLAYSLTLQRDESAEENVNWVGGLQTVWTRESVLKHFFECDEFRNRLEQ
ncbi:MAG: DUF4214 domain-containing protein [Huintestinicola sp.]